jgi:hypothetical protein
MNLLLTWAARSDFKITISAILREAAMREMKIRNLSVSEAEDVIAKIWIALEKHGLSSPKMTIFSRATKLEIEFIFESQRDESLVRAELPRTTVRKIKVLAMAAEIKVLSGTVVLEPELYTATLGCLPG